MTTPTLAATSRRWRISSTLPADWPAILHAVDGGFFHTPLGLRIGTPRGTPIYAVDRVGDEVHGVAVGVRTTARPGAQGDEAYFPTWPAFRPGCDRPSALVRLRESLAGAGVTLVRWDSFDAGTTTPPAPAPSRLEYVLDLAEVDRAAEWPPAPGHRRAVSAGTRDGWQCRELHGDEASAALVAAMERVVHRAEARGVRVTTSVPAMAGIADARGSGWGVSTFVAERAGTLLAAILVGWTDARAYYLLGGATEEGHGRGACAWLHATVACLLIGRKMRHYNLGGARADGRDPMDAAYGLHRFKEGFGARPVPCAGDRWILTSGRAEPAAESTWSAQWAG